MSLSLAEPTSTTLQVYLLGSVDFDVALALQRRLHFEVGAHRQTAALIVCEHLPLISIGRLGSHAHIRQDGTDSGRAAYPQRWVNRGGGCVLHVPGQLAVYPIFPLDRLGLDVTTYLGRLAAACLSLVASFSLRTPPRADAAGVWVGDRLLAALGISVRSWVTLFGAYLNVQPALEDFRLVRTAPRGPEGMTSLERERRGPVRPALVRQMLIEQFQAVFGFTEVALFSDHPLLSGHVARSRERAVGLNIARPRD